MEEDEEQTSVKKIDTGSHHGGAWKVAYADFVTAMMAFFLLLWLLNVTTDEEKNAISNYFDPTHPKVSEAQSGAGGVLGGLSMTPQGSMATNVQNIRPPTPTQPRSATQAFQQNQNQTTDEAKAIEKAKEKMRKEEEKRFKDAEDKIKQAMQEDPELAALSKNLMIDMTPEGLRIQIVDQEGEPMFASGSAQMFDKTKKLMEKVGTIIQKMPNEVSIRGHTDNVPYGAGADYTNWELSSDRANSTRRVLKESGVPEDRLNNVMGKADTEPLLKDNPGDPQNRRISIILLKEELTDPNFAKKAEAEAAEHKGEEPAADESESGDEGGAPSVNQIPIGTFRKTPGAVEFP